MNQQNAPAIGDTPPDFTLPAGNGTPVTLSDVYRGRHVLLYFARTFT